ncbi:MAG: HIT family protein [Promethearchaeota archaeon]
MTSDCVFCKIIEGKIPAKKIYEDRKIIAFLDINPISRGHTLIVPKTHFRLFTEGSDEIIADLFNLIKKILKLIKEKLNCKGFNILINQERAAGQVVDHFHVHVIPRYDTDEIEIPKPKFEISNEDIDEIFKKLTK